MNIADKVLQLSDRSGPSRTVSGLEAIPLRWGESEFMLVYLDGSPLYAQRHLAAMRPSSATFLSMHRSEAGIPCLTVHCTGNIGEAKYGGDPREVSVAPTAMMREALVELKRQIDSSGIAYPVSYEVTHHGPTVDFPVMFLEIGSSESHWNDQTAGMVVAKAALSSLKHNDSGADIYIGLGGPHYAPLFTARALEKGICFGHMVSWHHLPSLDREMLTTITKRNIGILKGAMLDWKGLREDKKRVASLLDQMNIRYVRA
jgi:D-tyrosyl-tRNA(Tyr) deacylase